GRQSKTLKEAKRKKRLNQLGVAICALVIVLTIVLLFFVPMPAYVYIPLILIAFILQIFFWLKVNSARKEIKKLKNQFCPKCGERYSFLDATYTELKSTQSSSVSGDYITASTYTLVQINCKCFFCGQEHSYYHSFLTQRLKQNRFGAVLSQENYSLDDSIREHFDW
ncbi:MAG: hypothetical protein K2N22_07045, partial [Clostridia bacterium]|nr:hypothetical protein [Clostridia bacterium]